MNFCTACSRATYTSYMLHQQNKCQASSQRKVERVSVSCETNCQSGLPISTAFQCSGRCRGNAKRCKGQHIIALPSRLHRPESRPTFHYNNAVCLRTRRYRTSGTEFHLHNCMCAAIMLHIE